MEQIYYIGQYSSPDNPRNLKTFPPALSKMDYILSALKRAQFKVNIFSPAETCNTFFCHFSRERLRVDDFESINYIDTFGGPTILIKSFSRIWMMLQLFLFLLFEVGKNDKVLVYHSLIYKWPIKVSLFLKKLDIYFEVEELYHAAWKSSEKKIQNEIKYLRKAKGYILVNDLIAAKCGFLNKPIAVCYGDYRMATKEKGSFFDNNIHLVYAGGINGSDSDVFLALEIMRYLPLNYRLHILGFGSTENVVLMKKRLKDLNSSLGKESIIFHGCLNGAEYSVFLSKCDIGLCTRVLVDEFSVFTFPSKVLVYLGNKLIPICSPISSVMNSQVSNYVVFSRDISPQSVANSVLSIKERQNIDSKKVLDLLDEKFIKSLTLLFN